MPGAPAAAGWRALLIVEVLAVAWLAFTPAPPPIAPSIGDKVQHMAAFGVMAATAVFAWPGRVRTGALALLAYGAFIELGQLLTATRSAEWGDLLADAIGIGLGQALALYLLRRTR